MKNIDNLTCRYCCGILSDTLFPKVLCCNNHITPAFHLYNYLILDFIQIGDYNKCICFYINDEIMRLYINYNFIKNVPIDPNLIPDNFEQKFKTYLNFS